MMNDENSYKKCDKCGEFYDASPLLNMCGDGESAHSKIKLYGDEFFLCPRCTYEIWSLVNLKYVSKEKKSKAIHTKDKSCF